MAMGKSWWRTFLTPGWDRWRPTKRFKPPKKRRAREIPTVELVAACLREGWSADEIVKNYVVPRREVLQIVAMLTRGMTAWSATPCGKTRGTVGLGGLGQAQAEA